jgi:hypothetical protein
MFFLKIYKYGVDRCKSVVELLLTLKKNELLVKEYAMLKVCYIKIN